MVNSEKRPRLPGTLQRVFRPGPNAEPESENPATPRFSLLIGESGFDGAGGEEEAGQNQRPVCFVWTEDGPDAYELAVRDVVRRQPVRTSAHTSASGPAPELADSVQGSSLPATC